MGTFIAGTPGGGVGERRRPLFKTNERSEIMNTTEGMALAVPGSAPATPQAGAAALSHSEAINELAGALAKAQGAMKNAIKDSANPFFKSKYADLASVAEACMGPLNLNGIAVIQGPGSEDGDMVTVHTLLCHSSGQWIRSALTMRPVKADPQGIGSCITYARRYALAAMCGVAPEDDDGNAASGKTEAAPKTCAKPKPAPVTPRTTVEQHVHTEKLPEFCPDCGAEVLSYFSDSEKNKGRQYYQCEAGHDSKTIKGHFWRWAEKRGGETEPPEPQASEALFS